MHMTQRETNDAPPGNVVMMPLDTFVARTVDLSRHDLALVLYVGEREHQEKHSSAFIIGAAVLVYTLRQIPFF